MQTHAARRHSHGRYRRAAIISMLAFTVVLAALVVVDPAGRRDSAAPVTGSLQEPAVMTGAQRSAPATSSAVTSDAMVFIEENTQLPGEGAIIDSGARAPYITRDEAADQEWLRQWRVQRQLAEPSAGPAALKPPFITRDEAADQEAMWEWRQYLKQHAEATANGESWDGILQDR